MGIVALDGGNKPRRLLLAEGRRYAVIPICPPCSAGKVRTPFLRIAALPFV